MKARPMERYALGQAFGEPSHVMGLGDGRALAVSRYERKVAVLEDGTARGYDLAPLAREPYRVGDHHARRGAPFRWNRGFGVAYRDVLHLWPTPADQPITLPMMIPDAAARGQRGDLEPLFACAAGEHGAIVALKAGVASIHSAHRLVRIAWDQHDARWDARDLYLDARAVEGEDAEPSESSLHPPTLESVAPDGDGVLLHSIGPSQRYARYGMFYSVLARLDASGATTRVVRIPDGYARIADDRVLLQALRSKSGGIDYTVLDREGAPLDSLRVTARAMAPVQNHWLTTDLCADDLWLSDNTGSVVRLALD